MIFTSNSSSSLSPTTISINNSSIFKSTSTSTSTSSPCSLTTISRRTSTRLHSRLYIYIYFIVVLYATLATTAHCESCPPSNEEDYSQATHFSILGNMSKLEKGMDQNGQDFDIFLKLMYDVNLMSALKSSRLTTSLLIPRDLAMKQTALDILSFSYIKGSQVNPSLDISAEEATSAKGYEITEFQTYQVIKLFANRFERPSHVLSAIMRNHILPIEFSLCDFFSAMSWKTWANQNISREGVDLVTENHKFYVSRMYFSTPSIRSQQGYIHQIDRMLMPDFSPFSLAPSPSPSPSVSPSISVSPSLASSHTPSPSLSSTPLPPSSSLSPLPSITSIPKISQALVRFSETATPSADPSTTEEPNSSRGSPPMTCFPASALVDVIVKDDDDDDLQEIEDQNGYNMNVTTESWRQSTSNVLVVRNKKRTKRICMSDLEIGDNVMSSLTSDSKVFMFTHRVRPPSIYTFLRLCTSQHCITLSHGHLVYVDSKLQAASNARVGKLLRTIDGAQAITNISEVLDFGLYAPHTIVGDIVVNGVVSSCYTTALKTMVGHALLTPLRALARCNIMQDSLSHSLRAGVHPFLAGWIQFLKLHIAV